MKKILILGFGILTVILSAQFNYTLADTLPCKLERNLSFGMQGGDVLCVQKLLNQYGYPITSSGPGSKGQETGYFGEATKRAVMKWQVDNGSITANADGIITAGGPFQYFPYPHGAMDGEGPAQGYLKEMLSFLKRNNDDPQIVKDVTDDIQTELQEYFDKDFSNVGNLSFYFDSTIRPEKDSKVLTSENITRAEGYIKYAEDALKNKKITDTDVLRNQIKTAKEKIKRAKSFLDKKEYEKASYYSDMASYSIYMNDEISKLKTTQRSVRIISSVGSDETSREQAIKIAEAEVLKKYPNFMWDDEMKLVFTKADFIFSKDKKSNNVWVVTYKVPNVDDALVWIKIDVKSGKIISFEDNWN